MNEPRRFVIIAEAAADAKTAVQLADRRIREAVRSRTGGEEPNLEGLRRWHGEHEGESYLRWASVRRSAEALGIKVHGHFSGEPGEPDAQQATRALRVLARARCVAEGVILIRDSDGDPSRRRGLEQARSLQPWPFAVVLGVAHAKRECWVLAGFVARTPAEERALAAVKDRIGFDPCEQPHELTARATGAKVKRNAKDAAAELTSGSFDRELACFDEPWDLLERRGRATGLPEYVAEVDERLLPLVL